METRHPCDGCERDCLRCSWLARQQAETEAWELAMLDRRIATDARLRAEVSRAEADWLAGR